MTDLSKVGEKSKDTLVALERIAHELPIARILIVFLLFCDCFIFVATGRNLLNLEWGTGKEITLGGVFLCVAAFSFVMTIIAPLCLRGVLWVWFNMGSELVYAIKSHLPEREKGRRSEIEEIPPEPTPWTEPPSYREEQLEKNLVSLPELYAYALIEQNPIALKKVEERESDYQAEFKSFQESSRTAYWSVMVSLLTIFDLSLGAKAKSTVLWIVIEKLKQYPLEAWVLGGAYVSAAVWPLVEFIKADLKEWRESRTKPVFYPPLAEASRRGSEGTTRKGAFHAGISRGMEEREAPRGRLRSSSERKCRPGDSGTAARSH